MSVFLRRQESSAATAQRGTGSRPSPGHESANLFAAKVLLRFLATNAVLLALSLIVYGWTPYLLWLAAMATTFQLFLRIRNIAEHACTTTGSDDPFTHARTTRANLFERATVAPYWVNYHAEHHLFMGVPCYNLAEAHAMLGTRGLHERLTIAPGYMSVLRQVSAGQSVVIPT